MSSQLHKTRGLVLRAVKYGETSLVVTIFTELFGIQSYLVNGVRTHSKKGTGKAQLFQPASLLDLVIYHNELKHLNRIKEFRWSVLYNRIFSDVPTNAVALFMVELLTKSLKQPEGNPDLFSFVEDSFLHLDDASGQAMANLPLFFALQLTHFFGFRIDDNYSEQNNILDIKEGCFVPEIPAHPYFLEGKQSATVSQLLKVMQMSELSQIRLNHEFRRKLLFQIETYYALHIPEFGTMKTVPVLSALLS